MSGCHSWRGCSPFVPSFHGSGSAGRQSCCLSLPQAVSVSHEPWIGTVWRGMVWCGPAPGCPPGWCQLYAGLSCCRLRHLLDCLKDMSAHSLAPLGSAGIQAESRHPKWVWSFVSEALCYVNLLPSTKAPGARQAKPPENCERIAEWKILMHVGGCWLLVAKIQSRKYLLYPPYYVHLASIELDLVLSVPLVSNHIFPPSLVDDAFLLWFRSGINKFKGPYIDNVFASFPLSTLLAC